MTKKTTAFDVFEKCVQTVQGGERVESISAKDRNFTSEIGLRSASEASLSTSMAQVATLTPEYVKGNFDFLRDNVINDFLLDD